MIEKVSQIPAERIENLQKAANIKQVNYVIFIYKADNFIGVIQYDHFFSHGYSKVANDDYMIIFYKEPEKTELEKAKEKVLAFGSMFYMGGRDTDKEQSEFEDELNKLIKIAQDEIWELV